MEWVQIEELVATALPDHHVLEVVPRTSGELSTVYEVRLDAEPTAVIVKIYADEWAWKQAKEVYVYSQLQSTLVPVPAVLYVGAGYTVLTKLEGVPLSQADVAPDDWYDVYRQLGQLVRRFHGVAQPAYGYVVEQVLDPKPDNKSYMAGQFAKKLQEFADLGGASDLHGRIKSYVAQNAPLLANAFSPVLCHNDIHEGNILVVPSPSGWRITGLIDVENAIAADPLIDLAKTDCYSIRNKPAQTRRSTSRLRRPPTRLATPDGPLPPLPRPRTLGLVRLHQQPSPSTQHRHRHDHHRRMTYVGSHLWELRQQVGSRLLVMPGAQVLLVDDEERALFQRRRDSGLWEIPAGAAEPGSSFRDTAVRELREESGLTVAIDDLTPFASLSEPDVHVITYPNGDRLHCFALCFEARRWTGILAPSADEVLEATFLPMATPPAPLQPQTRAVLDLHRAYRATNTFQAR